MNENRRVLVIGGTTDTGTVLRAVLEPRGTIVEHSRSQRALNRCAGQSPEVVVIDLDTDLEPGSVIPWRTANRVLIGSESPSSIRDGERFIEKPFHFPELVQVIEDLLESRPAA